MNARERIKLGLEQTGLSESPESEVLIAFIVESAKKGDYSCAIICVTFLIDCLLARIEELEEKLKFLNPS